MPAEHRCEEKRVTDEALDQRVGSLRKPVSAETACFAANHYFFVF
jgi:hypothetical protein